MIIENSKELDMSKKSISALALSIVLGSGAFFNVHAQYYNSPTAVSPSVDRPLMIAQENTWERDRASAPTYRPETVRPTKVPENTWQRDRDSGPTYQPRTVRPMTAPENTWQRDRDSAPTYQSETVHPMAVPENTWERDRLNTK